MTELNCQFVCLVQLLQCNRNELSQSR